MRRVVLLVAVCALEARVIFCRALAIRGKGCVLVVLRVGFVVVRSRVGLLHQIGGLFQEGDEAFERAAIALSRVLTIELGLAGLQPPAPPGRGQSVLSDEETRHQATVLGKILARRGAFIGVRMDRVQEGRDLLEQSVSIFRRFDERG